MVVLTVSLLPWIYKQRSQVHSLHCDGNILALVIIIPNRNAISRCQNCYQLHCVEVNRCAVFVSVLSKVLEKRVGISIEIGTECPSRWL